MSDDGATDNRPFDTITVGESASDKKTITKQDIDAYGAISGDANPTHYDETAARAARFEGIVAHSMLTAGMISSLLGNRLPGAGTVYRRQDFRFLRPVYAGDVIKASVTVREKRPSDHVVLFDCRCTNQDDQEILTGTAEVVAPVTAIRSIPRITSEVQVRRHAKYERLVERAKAIPRVLTVVAHPCDETSLRGVVEAAEAGMISPILVGPVARIRSIADQHKLNIGGYELVDASHSDASAAKAVELIRAGRGEVLMKGSLHTDELLRAVTAKDGGLRTARRISHVFIMDVPTYSEVLLITDAAVNIFPDLDAKRDIVQNAIDLHVALLPGPPRVAILSAVETVTAKIPGTIDAAALCKMADRGQIEGGILDGPLALDNAISPEAARIKGITSEVAGRAQILLVPDLEAGNMLAKNLSFLANADAAGIVLGARVPIVLTSRADTVRTRMASCAVASLYAYARRHKAAVAAE